MCESNHQHPTHPTSPKKNVINATLTRTVQGHHKSHTIEGNESDSDSTSGDSAIYCSSTDDIAKKTPSNDCNAEYNGGPMDILPDCNEDSTNLLPYSFSENDSPAKTNANINDDNKVLEDATTPHIFSCSNHCKQLNINIALHPKIDLRNKQIKRLIHKHNISNIADSVITLFPSRKRRGVYKQAQKRDAEVFIRKIYNNPTIQKAMDGVVYKTIQKSFSPFKNLKVMDRTGGK